MKFEQKFKSYVCVGDTISFTSNGIAFKAEIVHDDTHHINDDDCHSADITVTGCNPEQQKTVLAAREAWFNDQWFYCGVWVTASIEGHELDFSSLWGIEANYPGSDNGYLTEVANELLEEMLPRLRNSLDDMLGKLQFAIENF